MASRQCNSIIPGKVQRECQDKQDRLVRQVKHPTRVLLPEVLATKIICNICISCAGKLKDWRTNGRRVNLPTKVYALNSTIYILTNTEIEDDLSEQ